MLFDFKFDWDKSLEVGIKLIDNQHQEYFRIGRDIEQLILTGCKHVSEKELLDLLCEVRDYITYHFYTEERIMEEMGMKSSELKRHKESHNLFRKKVNAIDYNDLVDNPLKELKNLKAILQEWFFEHMLGEDLRHLKKD